MELAMRFGFKVWSLVAVSVLVGRDKSGGKGFALSIPKSNRSGLCP